MSWSNIDDRILSHPKMKKAVKAKGDAAWCMWSRGLVYTNAYDLDGRIPRDVVDELTADRKPFDVAAVLVRVGLWEEREDGDYQVHDFRDYNDSRAERDARRNANRDRVKKFRDKRAGITVDDDGNARPPERKGEDVTHYTHATDATQKRVSSDPIPSLAKPSQATPSRVVDAQARPPAAAPPADPVARDILAKLEAAPVLRLVASSRHAETLAGRVHAKGSPVAWVLAALDDLARDAQASADSGTHWSAEHMAKQAAKYVDHAKAPKAAPPKPGETLTPEQVAATQARRGVQQGSAGPAGDGNALIDAMLRRQGVLP